MSSLCITTEINDYVDIDDIKCTIKELHTRKATGFEGINTNVGINYFIFIINCCLKLQYIPKNGKRLKIKITEVIDQIRIIKQTQFGYQPFHSIMHQTKIIYNYIKNGFENKHSTVMVTLDVEKACCR